VKSSDGKLELPAGAFRFEANGAARAAVEPVLADVSTKVRALPGPLEARPNERTYRMQAQRIGVYQPWVPSMDEGWTRLVLERFHLPYTTLHNADIRSGGLKQRVDAVLIPSIETKTLREGYAPDETAPAYVGGLGQEGVEALSRFVAEGGTLVCLEDSCPFAIEALELPVTNVLKGLAGSAFYGPGSIVRLRLEPGARALTPLALGVPDELSACFDRSLAFEPDAAKGAVAVVRYAASDVLQSGWLLGPEKLQNRAAVVEVPRGKGRVILFAFPPQHRGQTHGTFRLLFNALLRGGVTLEDH